VQDVTVFELHLLVATLISRDPDVRLGELAATLNVTERTIKRVVRDLEARGLVTSEKRGRRRHRVVITELFVPVLPGKLVPLAGLIALFT
jgi:DNA-binding MarR family transcriptional regulator